MWPLIPSLIGACNINLLCFIKTAFFKKTKKQKNTFLLLEPNHVILNFDLENANDFQDSLKNTLSKTTWIIFRRVRCKIFQSG